MNLTKSDVDLMPDLLRNAMRVTLPYPPSINHYWATVNGRRVLSAEGRRFKETAGYMAMAAGMKPMMGDVRVTIDVYRPAKRGDLDNILKATLDSLRGIAFEDDKQVVEINARRFDDKDNPRAEVTVRGMVDQVQAGGNSK